MNKKYMVNKDGLVVVVTDTGEIINKKYTDNIKEILSLENLIESYQIKNNILRKRIIDTKWKIRLSKLAIFLFPPFITVFLILLLLVSSAPIFFYKITLAITFVTCLIMDLIEIMSIKKNKNKLKQLNILLTTNTKRINKITNKINSLKKMENKTKKEEKDIFIDVEKKFDYNFDPVDYFVEKYQIDKRTKEMNNKKTKKLIRKK